MSFGPEYVWYLSEQLKEYTGQRLFKIDGGDNWLLFAFSGRKDDLLLSWNSGFCGVAKVTEAEKAQLIDSVRQFPPITNILKSQLTGAELTAVRQLNRDKIIEFSFSKTIGAGFSSVRFLVFEIMERYSNVILLDESRNVVEAAKHIHPCDNRYRSVLPGYFYTAPPEFCGISLEKWLEEPDKTELFNIAGFGRKFLYAVENKGCAELLKFLPQYFTDVSNMKPQLCGKYITVAPELLNDDFSFIYSYKIGNKEVLEPLLYKDTEAERKKVIARINKELTRRERQLSDIMNLLNSPEAEDCRRKADLITANLWQLKEQTATAVVNCYNEQGEAEDVTIELNPALSPSKNAEKLYARYKKISAAQSRAVPVLNKVESEIMELKEQLALVSALDSIKDIKAIASELGIKVAVATRKKYTDKLPPHKRFDFDFAIVIAGLSAKGNRYATFKFANPDDLWFHAQGVPGAHIILRYTHEATAEEKDFAEKFCASLAACFCKTPVYGQRVDYCERKFVTAIAGAIANVTYREFKSIDGDPYWWSEQNY